MLILTIAATSLGAQSASATNIFFLANLDGFQEVPSVLTNGSGKFRSRLMRDGSIEFSLKVKNLEGTFAAAHIHFGQMSVNGGVMITLCGGPAPAIVAVCSEEVSGTISADFVRELTGQGVGAFNFDDALSTLRSGNTYVNVHTSLFPNGEIRGQVH